MAQGFSAAYADGGLDRGCYAAWVLPQGAELIRAQNPPLAAVAAALGFADQAHFSRRFRRGG